MSKPEIYVSIDIETDGPVAGLHSMLSLGAYICNPPEMPSRAEMLLSTFQANLEPLEDMTQYPETVEWWRSQPEAWNALQIDQEPARHAIPNFVAWCRAWQQGDHNKLVAVAWPAAFDFSFVNYYCHRFDTHNPLGFACADIRSYVSGLFNMPRYYGLDEDRIKLMTVVGHKRPELKAHHAADDATEQGILFMALLKEAERLAAEASS